MTNVTPNPRNDSTRDQGPHLEVVRPPTVGFNIDDLRVSDDEFDGVAVNRPLSIPVRRPPQEVFIRVQPNPGYSLSVCAIELKEANEFYVLYGEAKEQLKDVEAQVRR